MTAFIHTRLEIAPGLSVVLDGNSKITLANGTYASPVPNAFSLPAASVSGAEHCPGSTAACRASCYVKGLAKHAPDVYAEYQENAIALRRILYAPEGSISSTYFHESAWALGSWINKHARDGFRWHVSGDVWGADHARWITAVAYVSHGVLHWIYTRTLDAVPVLVRAPNLAVNVSADRDNWLVAREVAHVNNARVCYMATDELDARTVAPHLRAGDVLFPDYPLRGRDLPEPTDAPYWRGASHHLRTITCPADFFGQSEQHRCGPCAKCLHPAGRGA